MKRTRRALVAVAAAAAALHCTGVAAASGVVPTKDVYLPGEAPVAELIELQAVNDCADPANNDYISPTADVYAVPGPYDGGPLDRSRRIVSIGPIDTFHPLRLSAGPPGWYAIVIDECQDGQFTPGQDEVEQDAFVYAAETDVPPPPPPGQPHAPSVTDPSMPQGADNAAAKRADLERAAAWSAMKTGLETWEDVNKHAEEAKLGVQACVVADPVLFGISLAEPCFEAYDFLFERQLLFPKLDTDLCPHRDWKPFPPGGGRPVPPPYSVGQAACEGAAWIAKKGIFGMFNRMADRLSEGYTDLANDPPDPAFRGRTTVLVPPHAAPPGDGAADVAAAAALDASDAEAALSAALLTSIQRYQGAADAGDLTWALRHAIQTQEFARELAARIRADDAPLAALAAQAATAAPGIAAAQSDEALRAYVVTNGFTADMRRVLTNEGLTTDDLAALRDAWSHTTFAPDLSKLPAAVAQLRSTTDALATPLEAFASALDGVIATLRPQPATVDEDPHAAAGGPYSVGDTAVTLDASGSTAQDPFRLESYAWDLNGDGVFDDASGATPTVPADAIAGDLVGVAVTDDGGHVAIAYALVTHTTPNRPPHVDAVAPAPPRMTVAVGATQTFSVSASDADGDPLTTAWTIDGLAAGSGPFASFTTSAPGVHDVEAKVGDGHTTVAVGWIVFARAPDADGDGWDANVDCDDHDAAVNPGRQELLGNGKDDDCNPATTDGGSAPSAFFAPQVPQERNLALLEGGAVAVAWSSAWDPNHTPNAMLNADDGDFYPWATANGQTTNGWVKVQLAGGRTSLIDRVVVEPRASCCFDQRVKDFELAVSTTTADDAAFTTVLHATAADSGDPQTFVLPQPVMARYVLYRVLSNRGSSCCISTQALRVLTPAESGSPTVTFRDLSTDPDGDIVSRSWDFGDGTTATGTSPIHTYAATGTYHVTETVRDATGHTGSFTLDQRVLGRPQVDFAPIPASANEGDNVLFTRTIADPTVVGARWEFGDGSNGTSGTGGIQHVYGHPGTYTVRLTVTDTNGVTNAIEDQIAIADVPPLISQIANRDDVMVNSLLSFFPAITESDGVVSCTIDYGDGTSRTASPGNDGCRVNHIWSATGTYTVTFSATDGLGATSTRTFQVTVNAWGAQAGYAVSDYATGFPSSGTIGPVGLAFDSRNRLFVADIIDGWIYRIPAGGGVASPAKLGFVGGAPAGLAFTRDGRLYLVRQAGDLRELDPETGATLRTVVAALPCPTALATDPISGDLFTSTIQCGASVVRISNFASGPGTDRTFSSFGLPDGITFSPDGTMWAEAVNFRNDGTFNEAWRVAGTNSATPGAASFIARIHSMDGIAVSSDGRYLFANRNDGIVSRIDLSTSPPTITNVYAGGTRGDFVAVGPDGCLYATQTDRIIRITKSDGSCDLASTSVVPQLALSPATVTPSPFTRVARTFTARVTNVASPAGTAVTFTVTGANPQTRTVLADAAGVATLTYAGGSAGADTIVATAGADGQTLTSNSATVTWVANPNHPPVALDDALTVTAPSVAIRLRASDADGDPLTFTAAAPAHGSLSAPAGDTVTYTPARGYTGPDSFTFTAADGKETSNAATVTLDVRPSNRPPTVTLPAAETIDEGSTLALAAAGDDPDGDALTYAWSTDTGTLDGARLHVDDGPAVAHLTVTVSDSKGGTASATETVTVRNVAPTAALDAPAAVDEGSTFALVVRGAADTSSADTAAGFAYAFDCGGRYGDWGAEAAATCASSDDGARDVGAKVRDKDGGVRELRATVVVRNVAPQLAPSAPQSADEGTARAIALGSFADPGPDAPWHVVVDWGDGSAATAFDAAAPGPLGATHTYEDNGTYTATVGVTDRDGATGTQAVRVEVRNVAPTAELQADAAVDEGSPFRLALANADDVSAPDRAAGFEYAFDCGDGGGFGAWTRTASATCTTTDNGTRSVHAELRDKDGGARAYDATVVVRNVAPTADAGPDATQVWGLPATLAGAADDVSAADRAAGLSTTWSFGDGSPTAAGLSATHAYAQPGTYTATFTATDKDGGSSSDTATVTVTKRPTAITYTGSTSAPFGFATLSAKLVDAAAPGTPIGGRTVVFAVGGRTFTATTDVTGAAAASPALPPESGQVTVSFAGDDLYAPSQASATLAVTASTGAVTGGVTVGSGHGGFNAQSDGVSVKGELQFADFHAHDVTALGISGSKAWFAGAGDDGRAFVAYVEDAGEPGTADVFRLWVAGAPLADGTLSGGNVQVH